MHEASIARRIWQQIHRIECDHPGMSAAVAEVEVGPLSGIEPVLLQAAFQQLVAEHSTGNLLLVVREVGLTITCHDCGTTSELENFRFECRQCHGRSVQVTGGDGIQLLHVDLQTN